MNKKRCSHCKEIKTTDKFYKNKNYKDGFLNCCIVCHKEIQRKYDFSKDGIISKVYSCQKNNSKRRGFEPPKYTKEEFKKWVLSQDIFHKLHEIWVNNNYQKRLKPSIDRIDDNYGYSLDNIQITIYQSNIRKKRGKTIFIKTNIISFS
jgi:hypothetical protein